MKEEYYEKLLNIKTNGSEKWANSFVHCHPYEPTSYDVLDILFEKYSLDINDSIVDFGCGKGRLAFYINHLFKSKVVGVDMNSSLYKQALNNKVAYFKKYKKYEDNINFYCCMAQDYQITPSDNKFYFFNPFSVQIFIKIIENILTSIENHERKIQLILYYPSEDYIYYLENNTAFFIKDEIIIPKEYNTDIRERFLIYELCYIV